MCTNNATCQDGINEYTCQCHGGYEGHDCEVDIHECGEIPCQHDGLCFERSNRSLYEVGAQLPAEVMPIFDRVFAYGEAAGYVCSCQPGYEGKFLPVILLILSYKSYKSSCQFDYSLTVVSFLLDLTNLAVSYSCHPTI